MNTNNIIYSVGYYIHGVFPNMKVLIVKDKEYSKGLGTTCAPDKEHSNGITHLETREYLSAFEKLMHSCRVKGAENQLFFSDAAIKFVMYLETLAEEEFPNDRSRRALVFGCLLKGGVYPKKYSKVYDFAEDNVSKNVYFIESLLVELYNEDFREVHSDNGDFHTLNHIPAYDKDVKDVTLEPILDVSDLIYRKSRNGNLEGFKKAVHAYLRGSLQYNNPKEQFELFDDKLDWFTGIFKEFTKGIQ